MPSSECVPDVSSHFSTHQKLHVDILGKVFPAKIPAVSDANLNLSEAQKELLCWHQQLGHISFAKVKHLLGTGALAKSDALRRLLCAASASTCSVPKCAASLFAKQHCCPTPKGDCHVVSDRSGVLHQGNLLPGQEISVDHFICSQKGRLFQEFSQCSQSF